MLRCKHHFLYPWPLGESGDPLVILPSSLKSITGTALFTELFKHWKPLFFCKWIDHKPLTMNHLWFHSSVPTTWTLSMTREKFHKNADCSHCKFLTPSISMALTRLQLKKKIYCKACLFLIFSARSIWLNSSSLFQFSQIFPLILNNYVTFFFT